MTEFGTWKQPLGAWSDDTSFSLPLMKNLTDQGSYEDLMKKFESYVFHNEYTPDKMTFGIGNTCSKAIRNWSVKHYPALECGDTSIYSNGNGALMRLAPLAIHLVNESDIKVRLKLTREYTSLTHRHPRAIVASYIYLEILHELLNGKALISTLHSLPAKLTEVLKNRPAELDELPQFEAMFKDDFGSLLRKNIKSTGYVVDTLLACVWCVLNSTSIDNAIILAVNLGDDTDTIASITGTLSSCECLEDHVNDTWRGQLRNKKFLESIIGPFAIKESR